MKSVRVQVLPPLVALCRHRASRWGERRPAHRPPHDVGIRRWMTTDPICPPSFMPTSVHVFRRRRLVDPAPDDHVAPDGGVPCHPDNVRVGFGDGNGAIDPFQSDPSPTGVHSAACSRRLPTRRRVALVEGARLWRTPKCCHPPARGPTDRYFNPWLHNRVDEHFGSAAGPSLGRDALCARRGEKRDN